MHGKTLALLWVCIPFIAASAAAQTTVNPDISVIPRFLIQSNDGERLSGGIREFSRPDFSFQELELVLAAYLNPFARADVVMTLPGPDIEAGKLGLEELYATILRGLPLDLNLRLGKYRADFGRLNIAHPHAWPFITQPLSQERFLGEEGLNDLGISVSTLLPTGDVYTKLTLELLRGNAVGEAAGIADSSGNSPFYAAAARLTGFFSLDDDNDLEAGLSGFTGIHDPYNRDRFWYLGADVKYKYRPDTYTSLVVQGELLWNFRDALTDADLTPFLDAAGMPERKSISSGGAYVYADYQFMKIFSVGARADWSGTPYSGTTTGTGVSLFAGYYPVEETLGLRMEFQHSDTDVQVNLIALQILFSLGPHKAHPF